MITEPLVANDIAFAVGMLSSIDFDDQTPFPADEIHDVRSDGLPPHKFHATK